MNNINIDNYEAWLLDYAEGNLDELQCSMLFSFLNEYPHLKSLLSQGKITRLNPEKISFSKKSLLHKSEPHTEENMPIGEINQPQLVSDTVEFEHKHILYQLEINESNIEEFIIASTENILSNAEKNALNKYLYEHPEYEQLQEMYKSTLLLPSAETLDNKKVLYKNVAPHETIDELLIQQMEGIISASDELVLNENLLQNPAFVKMQKQYALTKLTITKEVYPNKEKLKRSITLLPSTFIRYAAAACVVLALGLFYFNSEKSERLSNQNNSDKNLKSQTENKTEDKIANNNPIPSILNKEEKTNLQKTFAQGMQPQVKIQSSTKKPQMREKLTARLPVIQKVIDSAKVEIQPTNEQLADKLRTLDSIETADANLTIHTDSQLPYISYANQTTFEQNELLTPKKYLQKIVNDNTAAAMGADNDIVFEALPAKQKMYGWFGWALRKISGNRLDLKTEFYAENSLAKLEVEGTKIKIIK